MIHSSKFFDNFGQFISRYPDTDLIDLFSKGQIESKRWLVNTVINLNLDLGSVFLCAGWYGTLATFIFESGIPLTQIRSFDIDPICAGRADSFNRCWVIDGWKFKASTLNIHDMTYPLTYTTIRANGTEAGLCETPNSVINTSCEHIDNFSKWYKKIPNGTLLILQSNNFFEISDHINCVKNNDEFALQTPMSVELFNDELELPAYKRFMRIGYK